MIVTYLGESYTCSKAIKGADYLHLLDSNGRIIVAFDGVKSFSGFSFSGGGWVAPTPEKDCYLAVIRDDGTIGKGNHKCCDISTISSALNSLPFSVVENHYSIAEGEDFVLKVPATDSMPIFIEIFVEQYIGQEQPPHLRIFNTGIVDSIDIPIEYGGTYSLLFKTCGSVFDVYIKTPDGSISYLDSMGMGYIYLEAPDSQGWSFDTEIAVKICRIDTWA